MKKGSNFDKAVTWKTSEIPLVPLAFDLRLISNQCSFHYFRTINSLPFQNMFQDLPYHCEHVCCHVLRRDVCWIVPVIEETNESPILGIKYTQYFKIKGWHIVNPRLWKKVRLTYFLWTQDFILAWERLRNFPKILQDAYFLQDYLPHL